MTQQNISFIHTADIHLGAKFGNLPPHIADLKRTSQREGFEHLVRQAIKKKANIFLIAGDLFESEQPHFSDVMFVKNQLQTLQKAGVRTFVIPGNHDASAKGNFWDQYAPWPMEYIFDKPEFESYVIDELQVEVVGMGFDRDHSSQNVLAGFEHELQMPRSILLFHGAWQNFGRELDRDFPFDTEHVLKVPCNYIALGHYHGFREVLSTDGKKAYYSGNIEGLDFSSGELGPRYAIYGKLDADGVVSLEQISLPCLVMRSEHLDISGMNLAGIDQQIQQFADPKCLMQLVLEGIPTLELMQELSSLHEHFSSLFAYLAIKDKTAGIPESDLEQENTYQGLFYRVIKQKMDAAPSEEEKIVLKNALSLGLGAFQQQ